MKHNTDLSKDTFRCLGVDCEVRTNCRRYLQRTTGMKPPVKTLNHHKEPVCFYWVREE